MKKINFCKATTIILIINVILSIVLFFVVPDNIACLLYTSASRWGFHHPAPLDRGV